MIDNYFKHYAFNILADLYGQFCVKIIYSKTSGNFSGNELYHPPPPSWDDGRWSWTGAHRCRARCVRDHWPNGSKASTRATGNSDEATDAASESPISLAGDP